jgi:hypothetical protein
MLFFAGISLSSAAFAAKYSGSNANYQFSAERTPAKKALPPEASALPMKELQAASPITFDELRLFVRDWRKYSRWLKTDGNEYKAVAYLGVSQSADYPPEVVKWMDKHGWAVDRFFLLERKFRITLSVQKQEAKQTVLKAHLEQQIRELDRNPSLSADQKKELKKQYQGTIQTVRSATSAKAPVTPEEYELIKLNHDVLVRVLDE